MSTQKELNTRILGVSAMVEDCYRAQTRAFSPVEYPFIAGLAKKNHIRSALDIGTGEGTFLAGLAPVTPDVNYTAIDADSALIARAQEKYRIPNVTFRNARFDPSFPEDKYDLIMARFAVEHIPDVRQFISEAFRRLSPGGTLLITEYYIDDLHSRNEIWRRFRQKEIEFYHKFGSHPRISTELPRYMRDTGFTGISSGFRQISPSTAGAGAFYSLVISYANLYHSIEPGIWTEELRAEIIGYCEKALDELPAWEDVLLISQTAGRKL